MATLDEIYELGEKAHRYERYVSLCCPFHDDNKPSLFAYADGFRCSSCGEWGDLDKLAQKLGKITIKKKTAVDYHSPWHRWLRSSTIEEVCIEAHRILVKFPQQQSYLKSRKIESQIGPLKIGWMDGWYVFPVFNAEREIIGAVARTDDGTQECSQLRYAIPPKQDVNLLYVPSHKRVNRMDRIFLPFGIIDCITYHSIGLASVTGTVGKRVNPESLNWIRKTIVITPDRGEEKEAYKLASQLGWRGQVKRLDYEDNTKDPNDILKFYGSNQLLSLVGA